MGFVPTIDLGDAHAARDIDRACREIGFFQIVGHGLDGELEASAWSAAAEFFRLPVADKLALAIPAGDAYGYGAFAVERLAASRGESTPPDLKETFSIGPFVDCPPELASDETARFVYSATPWPASLPTFADTMHAYYDALAELVERVMSLMAQGLGLDDQFFASMIDRHTSALRLLHYPDLRGHGVEPGQLRAGAHSDYGTLTLLRQDDAPGGLQVRDVAGEWHDVAPVDGAYVVNVGDALERWTNDAWRSTVHRVVVPPADVDRDCARQSIAFFHNANWDAEIACLPGTGTPRHEPVGAGEHLMRKFRSTQS